MPRIGIDTGGTFTDFVWLDEQGALRIHKQLSTPADPSRAILDGINTIDPPPDTAVIHGSTVATNALLERRGARTALITTAGFADILAIGRQNRPDIYALVPQKSEPLVPAKWRYEVTERVLSDGTIQTPLHLQDLDTIIDQLLAANIQSVAISLLYSFLRPEHERQIRQALHNRTPPDQKIHISLSSDILPEFREYERTSTSVINAYVAPLMSAYLTRLEQKLGSRPQGGLRRLSVMQSNGGIISAAGAGKEAARTVLSGPAGGVVGAQYVANLAGFSDLITFDMGGTSTDVALCPGRLPTTSRGQVAGMPMHLPIIDIHTVGAGGGSLAYVDLGGALHVGPQSAGANPGPACYGRPDASWSFTVQGQPVPYRVTTTDANLVLGRLDPSNFLGGAMTLDLARAEENLTALAQQLNLDSPARAAWHVIQVANATMERAIRRISVERGYDPRRFTLVAFGGAGPLHACELAAQIGIPRVFIPAVPGVLSALGMLAAAPTKDYSQTIMRDLSFVVPNSLGGHSAPDRAQRRPHTPDPTRSGELDAIFNKLTDKAISDMAAEGHAPQDLTYQRALDMRYQGQSYELTIPYTGHDLIEAFHDAHQQRFGYHRPTAPLEIVNLRLKATATTPPLQLDKHPLSTTSIAPEPIAHKQVHFGAEAPHRTALYQRSDLIRGQQIDGPAIIFQYDTTTVIPPDWQAGVDSYENLVISQQ